MKILDFSFLCIIFGCTTNDNLALVCPKTCYGFNYVYSFDPKTENIGECRSGIPVCDQDKHVIDCLGQVMPSHEICDGKDNDCNGKIDDDRYGKSLIAGKYSSDNICGLLGECSKHIAVCSDGIFKCDYQPQTETCDGLDNDCDGIPDNNMTENQLCFDDEYWKVTNPPCRAGVVRCIEGQLQCDGETLPSVELCDRIDNNCNGIIDDTDGILSTKYDILFLVDTSGSMCEEIGSVATALNQYTDLLATNTNIRWALAIMSGYSPTLQVESDFTNITIIQNLLLHLGCDGNSDEESLGALYNGCQRKDSAAFILSWDPVANGLIFAFTDEDPQSYLSPVVTALMIKDSCLSHFVLPFLWSRNIPAFEPEIVGANGRCFNLEDTWEPMFDDMNSIIVTLCGIGG